jgi:xanthine dehydrogenase molybdopterin-binding subunit B
MLMMMIMIIFKTSQDACEKLRERLDKHAQSRGSDVILSWEELVMSAYLARISLSSTGFFM